jgi:hypothetical protein
MAEVIWRFEPAEGDLFRSTLGRARAVRGCGYISRRTVPCRTGRRSSGRFAIGNIRLEGTSSRPIPYSSNVPIQ